LHCSKHALNAQIVFKVERSINGRLVVFVLSGRIRAARLAELQKLLEAEAGDHNVIFGDQIKPKKLLTRPKDGSGSWRRSYRTFETAKGFIVY
jgi:hypothetical protein